MTDKIAKKIICSSPPSIEYEMQVPYLSSLATFIDKKLQYWALEQSDNFSSVKWKEIQLLKLKKILIHAGNNVPFWQQIFREKNFNPLLLKELGELDKLPIISREQLKNIDKINLIAKNISSKRRVESSTSGTTGQPFLFYQDKRDLLRREVNTDVELQYGGLEKGERIVIVGLGQHLDLDHLGLRFTWQRLEKKSVRFEEFYPFISQSPTVLITTASIVKRIAFLAKLDGTNPKFKRIFYRGEYIDNNSKRFLSNFFSCELLTTYGTRECSLLGIECAAHKLHTAPWMNLVQIVNGAGNTVRDGTEGRVVVTFLENFVMPFIRYEIGDSGSYVQDRQSCVCGRASPLINIKGRRVQFIHVPGIKSIPLLEFTAFLHREYSGSIRQFQIIQEGEGLVILRFVPMSAENKIDKGVILSHLRALVGPTIEIKLEIVNDILPDESGKIPDFVRR